MSLSAQRLLLLGLAGLWGVLVLVRVLTVEAPQEVPLTFVSGRPVPTLSAAAGESDPWQIRPMTMQTRELRETPKKNIFAPLGDSTVVASPATVAMRVKRQVAPTVPAPVAQPGPVIAATPPPPPGPSPEELAEQAAQQQAILKAQQVREQMGQYRYIGYFHQHGEQKAFLGKGKEIYIIRTGDTVDEKFLVASIEPTMVKLKEPATSLETSLNLKMEGS